MPSDFVLKAGNTIHKTLVAVSGGRIGWDADNMPVLKLTTTGRKSGQPRTVMLTSLLQVDDAMVIVASKAGNDHHPAWFLNLRYNPEVQVETKGGPKKTMTARIATDRERDELWPVIVERNSRYGRYQNKTDRRIPLVFLE